MHTLAHALDLLSEGRLPEVADMLIQRFKAVEQSVQDGNWNLAGQLELVPDYAPTLASRDEQRAAARAEVLRAKLDEARKKAH